MLTQINSSSPKFSLHLWCIIYAKYIRAFETTVFGYLGQIYLGNSYKHICFAKIAWGICLLYKNLFC